MTEDTPVNITFQGPDYSATARDEQDHDEAGCTVASFDLDYGTITVCTNWEDGLNLRLAVRAPMCNEDGRPLGDLGWRIDPEEDLLARMPELQKYVGDVFGRVIVTAGGFPVDDERPE